MDNDAGSLELIHLADNAQSVTVRLVEIRPYAGHPDFHHADLSIKSDFVNAQLRIGVTTQDLDEWAAALDRIEAAETAGDGMPIEVDWPSAGRAAYLRFIADDPYLIEVHDSPQTQIVVQIPLDMDEDWINDARARLSRARAQLPK
jgi:hypothetical protein